MIDVKHDLEVLAAVAGACVAGQVVFGQGDHAVRAGWPLGVGLLYSVLINANAISRDLARSLRKECIAALGGPPVPDDCGQSTCRWWGTLTKLVYSLGP